jgi:Domain of unknown function (DUF4383)
MRSLQSPPMDGPSPARLYATLVGAMLLLAGIVGFFYSASFGTPGEVDDLLGVFAVNGWVNVLHILTGALGLIAADYSSRGYSLWIGAFYVVLAFWGFALGSNGAILDLLPIGDGANVLHLLLGALGVAAALGTPGKERRASPAKA